MLTAEIGSIFLMTFGVRVTEAGGTVEVRSYAVASQFIQSDATFSRGVIHDLPLMTMNKIRIYCNTCKGETWHESVTSHPHDRYNYFWGYSQKFDSEILKCCGCDDISFKITKHPFEFQDKSDTSEEFVYPDRRSNLRENKYFWNLPADIHGLYHETIKAHNSKLIVLSTVGVRGLIEAIVADKIDGNNYKNNLESKINALRPYFSESVIETLHEFRRMGNMAAHELRTPESINIHHALYVVESILEYFYSIDDHARMFNNGRNTTSPP